MTRIEQIAGNLKAECSLALSAYRSPECFASKLALLVGAGYLLGPWDLIPADTPYIGHLDEAGFLVGSIALARLLIPASVKGDRALADRRRPARDGWGSAAQGLLDRSRADLLTGGLVVRRRVQRAGLRLRRVANRGDVALPRPAGDAQAAPGFGARLFRLLGYRLWWDIRSRFVSQRCADRHMVVIGGAARSGTTLLRTILGRHPAIVSGPETTVFLRRVSSPADIGERMGWDPRLIERWQRDSRSQTEFIERFAEEARLRSGKPVWAEKTPHNAGRFGFIRRCFPHAKIIHIIRDGRDTVCSLRRKPFAKLDDAAWDSLDAARRCAVQWRNSVRPGLRLRGDPGYYELRYEDLVTAPEPTLRRLMHFLELPWDDQLLAARADNIADPDEKIAASRIFGSSIERWQRDLSPVEQRAVLGVIGPLLVELGYE